MTAEACPRCGSKLEADYRHCPTSPTCPWLRCPSCRAAVDRFGRVLHPVR